MQIYVRRIRLIFKEIFVGVFENTTGEQVFNGVDGPDGADDAGAAFPCRDGTWEEISY
ncbi:MAG: hypothetical protein HGB15_05465 [Chlorobaculum sp.]|nr:hypothetical protein [Chlorobaculum sp.]